ncbi:MAG TPA: c-type cytochrome domain-containing protein [Chthoniobacter sp.]|nr:c-type cytochrome domain-containing protein [Chthoniobacter sp.]
MLFPRLLASLSLFALVVCDRALQAADVTLVSFRKDIAPLLQRRCAACHGEESAKGGYRLDTYQRMSKAGDSDLSPLVSGKTKDSELYQLLTEKDPNDRMPQKADALPAHEIALVERWIQEGAVNDGGPADRPLTELVRESLLKPAPEKYARPVPVTALAFSPDGTQLAVSGYYEVTIWNLDSGALVRRIGGLPERITALAWHRKTKQLAVAGGTPAQWGTLALIDPSPNAQPRFLCDLPDMALCVAFSLDGARVAAGSADRTIRVFDAKSGRQAFVMRNHADWVQSIAYSPDGSHLLSASRDRTVRISNSAKGELETTYTSHETPVYAALFSTDGNTVASLAQNTPLDYWKWMNGDKKGKRAEVPGRPDHLAWVSGGLALGGVDGLVRIQSYDDDTLFTLYGHPDAISALAVGASSDQIATGSYDGTVCLWNLGCGTWVRRFIASPQ